MRKHYAAILVRLSIGRHQAWSASVRSLCRAADTLRPSGSSQERAVAFERPGLAVPVAAGWKGAELIVPRIDPETCLRNAMPDRRDAYP